jgi:DNA-directed RNA polymerase subunit RPC12/RpoP
MEFQDRILRCVDCGTEFIWTAGEQQFFADKNFKNEPKRCKACKGKRGTLSRVPALRASG